MRPFTALAVAIALATAALTIAGPAVAGEPHHAPAGHERAAAVRHEKSEAGTVASEASRAVAPQLREDARDRASEFGGEEQNLIPKMREEVQLAVQENRAETRSEEIDKANQARADR